MNTYCFKQKVNKKEFISKFDKVSKLADIFVVPIFYLPVYINKMTKQLSEVEKEIIARQIQIKQKIKEYNITIEELK
jgi:hypothetical protein